MKCKLAVLMLAAASLSAQVTVQGGKQTQIPASGATAVVSLDAHVADASVENGVLTILGVDPGDTRVIALDQNGLLEVRVHVTAGTPVYSGDSIYPQITSNPVSLSSTTVPDFTIASTTSSQTIAPGQAANYTISLASQNAFTGAVALSCSGFPTGYACNFAPASLTLNAAKGTAIMTISSARSAALTPVGGKKPTWAHLWGLRLPQQSPVLLLSVIATFVFVITRKISRRGGTGRFACVVIAFAAISLLQACGNAPITPATPIAPAPAKTYTLAVTGSSGLLKHSTTVILIVKGAE